MASEGAAVESGNGAGKVTGFAALKTQVVVGDMKAEEAVQFYKTVFGAEEVKRVAHQKRKADQETPLILCAELKIGSSLLLVCDQIEDSTVAVKDGGVGGIVLRVETDDVKGVVAKAVEAEAELLGGEIGEEEGELVGMLKDPFGVVWAVASKSCCDEERSE